MEPLLTPVLNLSTPMHTSQAFEPHRLTLVQATLFCLASQKQEALKPFPIKVQCITVLAKLCAAVLVYLQSGRSGAE